MTENMENTFMEGGESLSGHSGRNILREKVKGETKTEE